MNSVVIVLGIILIILVYVLYKYFTVSATTLLPSADLKVSVPPITSINSPMNVSYAYGVWIYVNTWDTTAPKTIFSRENNIKLYLDSNSPTLKCDIAMSGGAAAMTTTLTDNFPLQRWTYIIVSLDNQFLDCYLDGKLVVSNRLRNVNNIPAVPPDVTVAGTSVTGKSIYLGNNPFRPFDAYIAKFNRWTSPVDPQTAWNAYLEGNGRSTSTLNSYGVNLTVLQNNIAKDTYALL